MLELVNFKFKNRYIVTLKVNNTIRDYSIATSEPNVAISEAIAQAQREGYHFVELVEWKEANTNGN